MAEAIDGGLIHDDAASATHPFRAAKLCDWCSDVSPLLDDGHRTGDVSRPFDQLEEALANNCPICTTVYTTICEYDLVDTEKARFDWEV